MTTVQAGPATLPTETRSPGAVRTNRLLLVLAGVLLLTAGLLTLALGTGLLNPPAQDQAVLNHVADTWLTSHSWVWWPIAAGGVLLMVLCAWWLLAQARSNRVSTLRIGERTGQGRTTIAASALTDAIEADVETYRGVTRARAHLSGTISAPTLTLTVALDGRVDVDQVQQQVSEQALTHARTALGVASLPTRLELTVPRTTARDVR
ncbi:alkaline shock response membrane anchor protein AmaP [Klenkia sp. PcliD-1-E]|uniref:alkaline shock response membrane anchor protein AmaP n=1 Tax=Klenkia sp. PcliD-1-E TaxID=2954492 RepID=UPI0020968267|nr:alkaline shock response membrane anchor protein AmaP [Klenkia sp. PcliD-1-E]MCO7218360.1 alkaline shock response membrane anchor protein AmaP [Klenkia sp. PcliD-1-E]